MLTTEKKEKKKGYQKRLLLALGNWAEKENAYQVGKKIKILSSGSHTNSHASGSKENVIYNFETYIAIF